MSSHTKPPFTGPESLESWPPGTTPTTTSDTERLYFLAGHLNLEGTEADGWKLEVADTGAVAVVNLMQVSAQ